MWRDLVRWPYFMEICMILACLSNWMKDREGERAKYQLQIARI